MDPGRLRYSCKFPDCNNKFFSPVYRKGYINKHFFRFPKDNHLQQVWKHICELPEGTNGSSFYVCEDHFSTSDFVNSKRDRLIFKACPKVIFHQETVTLISDPVTSDWNNLSTIVLREHNYCFTSLVDFNESNRDEDILNSGDDKSMCKISFSNLGNPDDPTVDLGLLSGDNSSSNTEYLPDFDRSTGNFSHLENSTTFNFLHDTEDFKPTKSFLQQVGIRKEEMDKIHRNVCAKLSQLSSVLSKEHCKVSVLKHLYDSGSFQFIESILNDLTKNYINSQLQNCTRKPSGKWHTLEDKVFALSLYKRGPRLYPYLLNYFDIPSPRTLKEILSCIPFNPGLNDCILNQLKIAVAEMAEHDKFCCLLFDEMSLDSTLQYDQYNQQIYGYEDLGHLGRVNKRANYALIFMVRGIRRQWKQTVAYYFTSSSIIRTQNLKVLVPFIIKTLQDIGLKVLATVCDQSSTNQAALSQLSCENVNNPLPYTFRVNGEEVCIIYDIPHLLKNTRNALLRCGIEFEPGKMAKFKYIRKAFELDRSRSFFQLPYLKPEHFNLDETFYKKKVKIAARQLSHSMAACIETFVSTNQLPAEAIHTAEFASIIDNLFDLFNSNNPVPVEGKRHKCAFSDKSLHFHFFSDVLIKLRSWKLFDITGKNVSNQYSFVNGWQTSIRSCIHIWNKLIGKFQFMPMRSFNQDPLENLFGLIRQHGVCNTNPTCRQFVSALKTVVVNNLSSPSNDSDCEDDYCKNLCNLSTLIQKSFESASNGGNSSYKSFSFTTLNDPLSSTQEENYLNTSEVEWEKTSLEDSFRAAYVAGYLLSKVTVADCRQCTHNCFITDQSHLYTQEYENDLKLNCASERLVQLCNYIHRIVYDYLDNKSHEILIEDKIKQLYKDTLNSFVFCTEHNIHTKFIDKCIRLCIFKYVKEIKTTDNVSVNHIESEN